MTTNMTTVEYWQERSQRALESQGLVIQRRSADQTPPPEPEVIGIRRRGYQPIDLDLLCDNCRQHIPKSSLVHVTIIYYSPYGPVGSLHTIYYTKCIHCSSRLELSRKVGDVETLVVVAGATAIDVRIGISSSSSEPNNPRNEDSDSRVSVFSSECWFIDTESDSDSDSRHV